MTWRTVVLELMCIIRIIVTPVISFPMNDYFISLERRRHRKKCYNEVEVSFATDEEYLLTVFVRCGSAKQSNKYNNGLCFHDIHPLVCIICWIKLLVDVTNFFQKSKQPERFILNPVEYS